MRKWPEVVGIGSTVYDTLMVVPAYPTEDTKMEGLETKVQGGGPCATALVAARKLGVSAAYLGTIGDDPFGKFMMEDLEFWGVDTQDVRRVPDCVSFHASSTDDLFLSGFASGSSFLNKALTGILGCRKFFLIFRLQCLCILLNFVRLSIHVIDLFLAAVNHILHRHKKLLLSNKENGQCIEQYKERCPEINANKTLKHVVCSFLPDF